MASQLRLSNDIVADVVLKDIQNVHLSVYPPAGSVRIAAPKRMSLDTIRVFAISKLDWIKDQQTKLQQQARETPREYVDCESHYVWGKRYLLAIRQHDGPPSVELAHSRMILWMRPGAVAQAKEAVIEEWYRDQVKAAAAPLLAQWQPLFGVNAQRVFVQRMKTKWGSCNFAARTIRFNTELAKKPVECLEYIVAHELVHLLEPTHNARFVAAMDRAIPQWRYYRELLNQLPVRQESWRY